MKNLLLHKVGYSYSYLDIRNGPHHKKPSHPSPSYLCNSLCGLTASLKYSSNLCLCMSENPFDYHRPPGVVLPSILMAYKGTLFLPLVFMVIS